MPGSLGSENNGLSGTLGLRQPLFDLPRMARYRRGQAASEEGIAAFEIVQQKLLYETASTYLDILVARQNLETAETSMTLLSKQLARVREEANLGLADMVDIDESISARDEALAERINALHMLRDRQRDFTRLTGLNGEQVEGQFVAIPANHEQLVGELMASPLMIDTIPTIQQSLLEAEIAQTRVQELRGQHLPRVELFAQVQHRDYQRSAIRDTRREHSSSVGVAMSWELYAGGSTESQVREAELKLLGQQEKNQALKLNVEAAIQKQLLAIELGKNQIQANAQRAHSSRRKLEAIQAGKDLGIRSNFDILQAEKDSADAKRKLSDAYHAYYNAHLQLAVTRGTLDDHLLAGLSDSLNVSAKQIEAAK